MHTTKSEIRRNLPLVLVQLQKKRKSETIHNLTKLDYIKLEQRTRNNILQCHHWPIPIPIQDRCNHTAKCVKRAKNHHKNTCTKPGGTASRQLEWVKVIFADTKYIENPKYQTHSKLNWQTQIQTTTTTIQIRRQTRSWSQQENELCRSYKKHNDK